MESGQETQSEIFEFELDHWSLNSLDERMTDILDNYFCAAELLDTESDGSSHKVSIEVESDSSLDAGEVKGRIRKTSSIDIIRPDIRNVSKIVEKNFEEEKSKFDILKDNVKSKGLYEVLSLYSESLRSETNLPDTSELDRSLSEIFQDYRANDDLGDFLLSETEYSWNELLLTSKELSREELENTSTKDRTTGEYLREIHLSEEGSELEEIWSSLLRTHLKEAVPEEFSSLENSYNESKYLGSQIEEGLESIEEIKGIGVLPVGWRKIGGGQNRLIVPLTGENSSSAKLLYENIEDALEDYTLAVNSSARFVEFRLDAEKEKAYERLRKASENLDLDLDYGFLEEN